MLLQIPLEDIGVVSLPIVVKLGLGRREEVLGLRVVEAVSFAGHGPGYPRPLEREPAGGHPVLPAHVRMRQRGVFAIEPALEARRHPGAVFMFGDPDIDQATTSSLQGSTTGDR